MQIYFYAGGIESDELNELENRIRSRLPALQRLSNLNDVRRANEQPAASALDQRFIIFPIVNVATPLDRLIGIAEQEHPGTFLLFVSREISASDYKRLVRSGGAEWVSLRDAPREIEEIVARAGRATKASADSSRTRPAIVAFLPSSGGVGNTTLALEAAVQLKLDKKTRSQRVCLLDLDLQTSHVCDYLDIKPRLEIREILDDPDRLDSQLFDLLISHHSSGLDVLATPRNRQNPIDLDMEALDKLFEMLIAHYDLVIVDLPTQWQRWTRQMLSVCDLVIVSGLNTVPGLRQVADTVAAVKSVQSTSDPDDPTPKIVIALNRCGSRLVGGVARAHHIKQILPGETVHTVRQDAAATIHAVNTGIPIAIGSPSAKIAKDIRTLTVLLSKILQVKQ